MKFLPKPKMAFLVAQLNPSGLDLRMGDSYLKLRTGFTLFYAHLLSIR